MRHVRALLVGGKYSPIPALPGTIATGGELFRLGLLLLLRADVGLSQVDAGTGEHFPQTRQGIFQRLAHFLMGADELGAHLFAVEAQIDLDRAEMGGSDVDLGALHIAARQPQHAIGKLLRPFVVM